MPMAVIAAGSGGTGMMKGKVGLLGASALALALLGALAFWGPAAIWPGPGGAARPGWSVVQPPHDVNALAQYRGRIWAGGRDGVAVLDIRDGTVLALPDGTPAMGYVKALLVDRAGRLWVGHRTGLARFDGTGWLQIEASASIAPGPVTALVETGDGRILVGGEAGLAVVTGTGFEPVGIPSERAGAVLSLFEDSRARLWVGLTSASLGGLMVQDADGWRALGRADGLAHLRVNHIAEDGSGALWLATGFGERGGACRLDDPEALGGWRCIGAADGLASDMVRLVFEDRHGQLWFGTEFDGAAVVFGGQSQRLSPADGLSGYELKAMLEDSDGNLWLGSDKGLTRIDAAHSRLAGPGAARSTQGSGE